MCCIYLCNITAMVYLTHIDLNEIQNLSFHQITLRRFILVYSYHVTRNIICTLQCINNSTVFIYNIMFSPCLQSIYKTNTDCRRRCFVCLPHICTALPIYIIYLQFVHPFLTNIVLSIHHADALLLISLSRI